jgi:hypothetical protein
MKLPLVVLTLVALVMLGCSKPTAKTSPSSASSDNLFVWNRPIYPLPMKLPITQSATCRFKKGLAVSFERLKTDEPNAPERVYYSASDENEADTVAFLDLDTNAPKVQSNGGQASLKVLYKDGQMLTLINTSLTPQNLEAQQKCTRFS